jgi:hypothetical protein
MNKIKIKNENKNLLGEINRYINHGTNDIYSVLNEITSKNYEFALNNIEELKRKELESPLNNKKIIKLFEIFDFLSKSDFVNKTSNNGLSNYIRFKNIASSIDFMAENINADAIKKPIISYSKTPFERFELTDLSSGNYLSYDVDKDFLYVNTKGKFVILEGREESLKKLLKEKIIIPLQNEQKEERKNVEIKQKEIYENIKEGIKNTNYTPHSNFKEILNWEKDDFETFINKFTKKEIDQLKNNLTENIKSFEDKAISGNSMNSEFDNIGSRHRSMLDRINEFFPNKEKNINNKINKI